jgi:hypothetical protein
VAGGEEAKQVSSKLLIMVKRIVKKQIKLKFDACNHCQTFLREM